MPVHALVARYHLLQTLPGNADKAHRGAGARKQFSMFARASLAALRLQLLGHSRWCITWASRHCSLCESPPENGGRRGKISSNYRRTSAEPSTWNGESSATPRCLRRAQRPSSTKRSTLCGAQQAKAIRRHSERSPPLLQAQQLGARLRSGKPHSLLAKHILGTCGPFCVHGMHTYVGRGCSLRRRQFVVGHFRDLGVWRLIPGHVRRRPANHGELGGGGRHRRGTRHRSRR